VTDEEILATAERIARDRRDARLLRIVQERRMELRKPLELAGAQPARKEP
jgi:hypothetical protein